MSKSEVLSVDLLRVDGDTQARVAVNQDVVDEYAELVSAGKFWPFESITVFHDGTDYWIADGFHRTLAAKQAGRSSVPCNVITGTARDARIYGMRANDEHGLRMSREDRRKNVLWLLEAYPEMTQKEIAEKTGAGERTVRRIVEEKKEKNEKRPLAGSASKPRKTQGETSKKASKKSTSAEEKEAEKAKKLAEREAEKARKAAEKEAEKVRKAAEKEAEKAKKAAEREATKIAKEAERAAAKEAAAKAKEEAKKAARAAKAKEREDAKEAARKELPTKEQEKMLREVFNQHHGRIIKAMADFFELNPNRTALNANMKLLNQVKLW